MYERSIPPTSRLSFQPSSFLSHGHMFLDSYDGLHVAHSVHLRGELDTRFTEPHDSNQQRLIGSSLT